MTNEEQEPYAYAYVREDGVGQLCWTKRDTSLFKDLLEGWKEIPLYKTSTIRKSQIVRHTKEKNMEVFKVNEFDFEVIRVEEYEDGSADLEIHMSEESKRFLINYAFLDIIKKAAGQFEEHFDDNIEAIQVPDRPIEFDWSHEKGAEVRTDVNQGNSKLDETQK